MQFSKKELKKLESTLQKDSGKKGEDAKQLFENMKRLAEKIIHGNKKKVIV